MTPVSEVLGAAADRVEKRGAWSQGFTAKRPADHDPDVLVSCLPSDKSARRWSMLGAIFREDIDRRLTPAQCYEIERSVGLGRLSDWNDAPGRTQAEVVAALRQAALRAASRSNTGEASNVR